jgi:hypothetical protein
MQSIKEKSNIFICLFLFTLLVRGVFGPPNFSPLDAIALFCGAYFNRYASALVMSLVTVWLSDVFINKIIFGEWIFFYEACYWQYASYVLITSLGTRLSVRSKLLSQLMPTCFAAAVIFFLISNAGVWYSGTLYSFTLEGLLACYVSAIPFFKNTLLSDFFFSLVLFKGFACLRALVPLLAAKYRSVSVIQD